MNIKDIWNGWEVEKLIGEGSFGKVYKIVREEFGFKYESALKVIMIPQSQAEEESARHDGMSEDSIREYFLSMVEEIVNEFALMSRLRGNTNIVSYEDHKVIEKVDGFGWEVYIRMELLTPLYDYLRTHSMTVRDIILLGIDICSALEVCQKYNIIHRDIKPENIFVSSIGSYKLGDFGIARQLEKTSSGMSKKGTYTYMAPEVYKGLPYDSTVDIYSLGIVLYRYLNDNRAPFMPPAPTPIRYADRERANIRRMSGEPIPAPCFAEGRLAEIVLKACSYNPKDRYESAAQMKRALQEILYSEGEASIIYPNGDDLPNSSNKYATSDSQKDVSTDNMQHRLGNLENDIQDTSTIFMFSPKPNQMLDDEAQKLIDEAENKARLESAKNKIEREEVDLSIDNSSKHVVNNPDIDAITENEIEQSKEDLIESIATISQSQQDELEGQNKGSKLKLFLMAVIAVIVLGGGAFYFSQATAKTTVPKITKATLEDAAAALKENDLSIGTIKEVYSDSVKEGLVVSQSIHSGDEVTKNTAIDVEVSNGVQPVVPSLKDLTKKKAKTKLEKIGLKLKVSKEEYSKKIAEGNVISQDVKAKTAVEKGDTISVVISKGVKKITVPNVRKKTTAKAKSLLKKAGFKVKVVSAYSSSVSKGRVVRQSASSGSKKPEGSTITITVSKGRKPVKKSTSRTTSNNNNNNRTRYNNNRNNNSNRNDNNSSNNNPEDISGWGTIDTTGDD